MADFFDVDSVEDAVTLAMRLRAEGRYDLFRGQVRNYQLVPSLHRIEGPEKEATIEKFARFEGWVHNTLGLEELARAGTDAMLAVAQHYGLPTPFLDFTTDPEIAGFFACDAADVAPGEESCIVCLDTGDLARFWASWSPELPPPEVLSIDVSNLWRLQAQKGVFLFCPYDKVEHIYDFDRIRFPAAHPAAEDMRARVYPPRKSQLEILLDQYFMNERLIEGSRFIESTNWDISVVNVDHSPDGIHSEVVDSGIPALASWRSDGLKGWRSTYDERLSDVHREDAVRLEVDLEGDLHTIASRIGTEVSARIACSDASRDTVVDWQLDLRVTPNIGAFIATLEAAVNWLWDGLRTLPHSDEDLAIGIGNCVAISIAHRRILLGGITPDDWEAAATAVLGPAVEVELGADDGSYAKCYAAEDSVAACIRDDIDRYLTPGFRAHLIENPVGMLQVLPLPDRLFEFDRLARLMARELSPTQVLMRPGRSVYFSPARIIRMGLP